MVKRLWVLAAFLEVISAASSPSVQDARSGVMYHGIASNGVEQFLNRSQVSLFRPFTLINGVEAARYALATRILHNEPGVHGKVISHFLGETMLLTGSFHGYMTRLPSSEALSRRHLSAHGNARTSVSGCSLELSLERTSQQSSIHSGIVPKNAG